MTDKDEDLEKTANALGAQLRQAELDVPSMVAQRLQAARRQAVAQAQSAVASEPGWSRFTGWSAAASALLVLAVGVAVFVPKPVDTMPRMNEAEIAAAQESELLQELEFVAWMVAMEEANELPNSG